MPSSSRLFWAYSAQRTPAFVPGVNALPARGIWQVERGVPANPLEKTQSFAHTDKNGYVAASETSGEKKREKKREKGSKNATGPKKKSKSALETERKISTGERTTLCVD